MQDRQHPRLGQPPHNFASVLPVPLVSRLATQLRANLPKDVLLLRTPNLGKTLLQGKTNYR